MENGGCTKGWTKWGGRNRALVLSRFCVSFEIS
jgi:hypothetical protein